ncbi:hypothetical protein D3C86_1690930 [compost metagenome]
MGLLLYGAPDALRGGGGFGHLGADGVGDRRQDGRRRPDQGRLADAAGPVGTSDVGVLEEDRLDGRHVHHGRQDVVGETGVEDLALPPDHFLHEGHAEALGDAPLDLAGDQLGVEGLADVVNRDDALHLDLARLDVDQ